MSQIKFPEKRIALAEVIYQYSQGKAWQSVALPHKIEAGGRLLI